MLLAFFFFFLDWAPDLKKNLKSNNLKLTSAWVVGVEYQPWFIARFPPWQMVTLEQGLMGGAMPLCMMGNNSLLAAGGRLRGHWDVTLVKAPTWALQRPPLPPPAPTPPSAMPAVPACLSPSPGLGQAFSCPWGNTVVVWPGCSIAWAAPV